MLGPPTICNNTDVGNSLMVVVSAMAISSSYSPAIFMEVINCLFMASPEIAQFSGITVLTF